MKKNVLFLVLCTLSLCAFFGCNNGNEPDQKAKSQTYHVTIQAGKGESHQKIGPRRALGMGSTDEAPTAYWAAGEKVTVRNLTKNADLTGYLEAQSPGVQTTISGDLEGVINAGDALELKFLSPNYSEQLGTLEYIAANCDYAVDTIHVASVTWGNITFEEDTASFENQQAIVKITMKDQSNDDPLIADRLVVEANSETYTINPATPTNELFVALPGFSNEKITLTATVGSDTYTTTSSSGKTLVNGKYYTLNIGMNKKVPGFSIDATHQIAFAKGNLQYKHSETKWRIAENQYDFVGTYYTYHSFGNVGGFDDPVIGNVYEGGNKCDNTYYDDSNIRNDHMSTDCWIDLFGWNTWNKPLLIDNDNSVFATDQSSFTDWGANVIYDGDVPRPANYWRTLTEDEWKYILCGRDNAEHLCGTASITVPTPEGDVDAKGLVLLPDDFEKPDGITFHYISDPTSQYPMNPISYGYTGAYEWPNYIFDLEPKTMEAFMPLITSALNDDKYMFNQNRYTVAQWEELEAAGAVFLPAAGVRWPYPIMHYQGDIQGVRQFDVNFIGMYWTSSYHQSEDANYLLMTYESGHVGFGSQPFGTGQSVRLVRDL